MQKTPQMALDTWTLLNKCNYPAVDQCRLSKAFIMLQINYPTFQSTALVVREVIGLLSKKLSRAGRKNADDTMSRWCNVSANSAKFCLKQIC
jgi:hypothetical protein